MTPNSNLKTLLERAVVKILHGDTFKGTGFFIAPDYLLTAHHCLRDCLDKNQLFVKSSVYGKLPVFFDEEKSFPDPQIDIAVLKLQNGKEVSDYLPLGLLTDHHVMDDILAVGYPAEILSFIPGQLHGFPEHSPHQFFNNAMKAAGQSGGPVYHFATRRVVGLALSIYSTPENFVRDGGLAGRFEILFKHWPELQALNQQAVERWEGRLQNIEPVKPLLALPTRWWYYGLASLLLLAMLILMVLGPNSLLSDPNVKLVDYSVTYSSESRTLIPEIDLKMRNTGDQVAFIKRLEIEVISEATYEDCRNPAYSLVEVSAEYDIDLIRSPQINISHAIKPAEVDRIKVSVGRSEGGPTLTVYKTILKLIYDEDNKVSKSEPIFLKMMGPTVWAGMFIHGVNKEEWEQCVKRNKEIFGKIGYDIYGDNPIIKKTTQIDPIVR